MSNLPEILRIGDCNFPIDSFQGSCPSEDDRVKIYTSTQTFYATLTGDLKYISQQDVAKHLFDLFVQRKQTLLLEERKVESKVLVNNILDHHRQMKDISQPELTQALLVSIVELLQKMNPKEFNAWVFFENLIELGLVRKKAEEEVEKEEHE